ncbi:MAG TPA: chemotaxis protein CheW [Thermoanaerobaculia bacterium]|nr:chemotaxis protein CheW [Thermoanaerobaculia bacterium]
MESTIDSAGIQQYLTFRVAGEEYALGILEVREIIEFSSSTRVPGTPPWIRGVINLRGRVVPVIDLSVRFGLGATEVTQWTCAVIVEIRSNGDATVMGVLADAVSEVLEIDAAQIEPPPSFGTVARAEYLVGVARAQGRLVLVLDSSCLLTPDEVGALPQAAEPAMAAAAG